MSLVSQLQSFIDQVKKELKSASIRCKVDDRGNQSPGWKYNHWEQKGVPLRLEVGPRDAAANTVMVVRRVDGVKASKPVAGLGSAIRAELDDIHQVMFAKASAARDSKVVQVTSWSDFVPALNDDCLVLTPWCSPKNQEAEDQVKERSREESLALLGLEAEDERTATSLAAKTLCARTTNHHYRRAPSGGLPVKKRRAGASGGS